MSNAHDDIEHLKVNKIPQPSTSDRVFLRQQGQMPAPADSVSEAFGGSGEAALAPVDPVATQERVIEALKTIFDPEIPLNIYELGLIYDVQVSPDGNTEVKMTLTAPACPVAGMLVQQVADKAGQVEGVTKSRVELVWDPPWTPDRMSDEAKLELGLL